EEGDDLFAMNDFDNALKKYREARVINTELKEAKDAVDKTRKAIEKKKEEEKQKAEREKHISELKKEARTQQSNFNFKAAKVICDSLVKDYGTTDADILKMSDELSRMNAAMEGINREVERKNLKEAIRLCEIKIN